MTHLDVQGPLRDEVAYQKCRKPYEFDAFHVISLISEVGCLARFGAEVLPL
jgi:hypothetical protein